MFKRCRCSGPDGPQAPRASGGADERSDFLYKAYSEFQSVIRFADAKAAGVLVLLGLGLKDLLDHAPRLSVAHDRHDPSLAACVTSIAFWLALPLAVAVVAIVTHALFPRLKAKDKSLFYFGDIGGHDTASLYLAELEEFPDERLHTEVGKQVWQLSRIATTKMRWLSRSYYFTLAFLALWAVARVALFVSEQ